MKTLLELKSGDTVIIHNRDYLDRPKEIERITKTQIVVAGVKYRRNSGQQVSGNSYYLASIRVPKEGEIEECFATIRLHKAKAYLSQYPWNKMNNIELLEKIKALLPASAQADSKP